METLLSYQETKMPQLSSIPDPAKGEFLSHAGKQQTRGSISHTKNPRMSQPLQGEQGQAVSQTVQLQLTMAIKNSPE